MLLWETHVRVKVSYFFNTAIKILVRNNLKEALPNFSVPEGSVNMTERRTE